MKGQLAGAIAATQTQFQVQVKRDGRLRDPNLSDAQLAEVGKKMVWAQKMRWQYAVNAEGRAANKLTVRYAIIKQSILHKRPKRDMSLTGKTVENFTLRKAANGLVRAENTRLLERQKAQRCQLYDQMIGMASTDVKTVLDESQVQFGEHMKTAWIPVGDTNRRPPGFTPPQRPVSNP